MKWGVRRFQNEDGSLTEAGKERYGSPQDRGDEDLLLKAGSRINHVSSSKKIKLHNEKLYGYDANDEWDKTVYRGAYSKYLQYRSGKGEIFDHTFETTKDLLIPSRKKKVEAFIDIYKNNKVGVATELEQIYQSMKYAGIATEKYGYKTGKEFYEMKSEKDFNKAYDVFIRTLDYGKQSKSGMAFVDSLISKGYTAMIDDNNAVIYNKANNPLIVFDSKKSLKEVGKARKMSYKEINDNVEKIRNKTGKVML